MLVLIDEDTGGGTKAGAAAQMHAQRELLAPKAAASRAAAAERGGLILRAGRVSCDCDGEQSNDFAKFKYGIYILY